MKVDHSYNVTATPAPKGDKVHVSIEMKDTTLPDGDCVKSVDLGEFANHREAAAAASEWVKTDLDTFSIFK